MEDVGVIKYKSVNLNPETKLRIDKNYYEMKFKKGFKTFDQFINYLLDVLEKNNK